MKAVAISRENLPSLSGKYSLEEIKQSPNQLSALNREGLGEVAVSAMIAELATFVRMELNAEQVRATARLILSEFWYLKLEDLVEIFRAGMKSKQFGPWNYQTFCEWVLNYEQGKLAALEASHSEMKGRYQSGGERAAEATKISDRAISWADVEKEKQKYRKDVD